MLLLILFFKVLEHEIVWIQIRSYLLSCGFAAPDLGLSCIMLGKQIQTNLRLISVSLSNILYCIYDASVVSRCTLYLNKIFLQ